MGLRDVSLASQGFFLRFSVVHIYGHLLSGNSWLCLPPQLSSEISFPSSVPHHRVQFLLLPHSPSCGSSVLRGNPRGQFPEAQWPQFPEVPLAQWLWPFSPSCHGLLELSWYWSEQNPIQFECGSYKGRFFPENTYWLFGVYLFSCLSTAAPHTDNNPSLTHRPSHLCILGSPGYLFISFHYKCPRAFVFAI